VGKFFKIIDGEQGSEPALQKKRTHFKNEKSDEDIQTEDYFAAQHVTLIVGVMKQLRELSQTSQHLFTELLSDAQKISERIEKIDSRAKNCRNNAIALKQKVEKDPKLFLKNKKAPRITFADPPTFIFDASTASKEFLNAYDAAKPVPASIADLDVHEDACLPRLNQDTLRSYVQRYSDPYRIYLQYRESKTSLSEVKKKEERARRQNKREAKKMSSPDNDMKWKDRLDKHGFKVSASPNADPLSPNPNIAQKTVSLKDPQPKTQYTPEPTSYQEDNYQQQEQPVYQSEYKRFVAIYDFSSDDPQELSFSEGDEILISQQDGEWWWGDKDGRQGYVPANHLEEIGVTADEEMPDAPVEDETHYQQPVSSYDDQPEQQQQSSDTYQTDQTYDDQYDHVQHEVSPVAYEIDDQVQVMDTTYQPDPHESPIHYEQEQVDYQQQEPTFTGGAPPPPPPPPMPVFEAPRTNISDLHAAIKQGKELKRVETSGNNDSKNDLLKQVRDGITLRSVKNRVLTEKKPPTPKEGGPVDVAAVLKQRFANELAGLNHNSDSESDIESEDEWSE